MQAKVLVIDDDPKIGELLTDILKENDYSVAVAKSTEEGWEKVVDWRPDLILLDVEVPLKGGLEFCRELKEKKPHHLIPVIFLTVRDQEIDKVCALNMGGDDFITKPFRYKELLARINVAMRRSLHVQPSSGTVRSGTLFMDLDRRVVQIKGRDVKLTPKEFDLFRYLYMNRNRVMNDREIFHQIWGSHSNSLRSTVYTHINRLRKKMKEHGAKIKTIPGVGFRFDERAKG